MAKLREQPTDVEIAARARELARQLSGRVFVSNGMVCLVHGLPKFPELNRALQAIRGVPEPGDEPTPARLGFAAADILPLGDEGLAARGRALQKWRKILGDKEQRKQRSASVRRELKGWHDEVGNLGERLACLYQQVRSAPADGAALYLPPEQTVVVDVAARCRQLLAGKHVPPHWAWFGEMVLWIAGGEAFDRFLLSIEPALVSNEETRLRGVLEGILDQVRALDQQLIQALNQNDPLQASLRRQFKDELNALLDSVPLEVADRFGLKIPGRPRDLFGYMESLQGRCQAALARLPHKPENWRVAGVAALCAVDGAKVLLPRCLLFPSQTAEKCSHKNDPNQHTEFNDLLNGLWRESGHSGYDRLLASLDSFDCPRNSLAQSLGGVRILLGLEASAEDVAWLIRHSDEFISEFARKSLSPAPVKRLVRCLEGHGWEAEDGDVNRLLQGVSEFGELTAIRAFALWLEKIPLNALGEHWARAVWHSILAAMSSSGLGERFGRAFDRWANPPAGCGKMPGLPSWLSPEARQWINHIAFYQALSGHSPGLPKSLAKLLISADASTTELQFLRGQQAEGRLTSSALRRLELLEACLPEIHRSPPTRVLKQAQEVCAITALEAIQHVIATEVEIAWGDLAGGRPSPVPLSSGEKLEILAWVKGLKAQEKARLNELMDAWSREGFRYRLGLRSNAGWLSQTLAGGFAVEKWLFPEPQEVRIGEQTFTLGVIQNPFIVLLMGSYFDTCLDLAAGCNRDSVLANACDANKAVLYVRGQTGRVVGRKLVAVNTRGEMLGYRTYARLPHPDAEGLKTAIHSFCGSWSRAAGLSLSNQGRPTSLADLFWYDDGVETWLPAAQLASRDSGESLLHPRVAGLVRAYRQECVAQLCSFGLWPPAEGDDPEKLIELTPGLLEECLAWFAREEGHTDVAELLFKYAATPGGRLEALSSVAQIRGDAFLVEMLDACRSLPWEQSGYERAAGILIDWDTPASIRALARLCLQQRKASALNLVHAVTHSKTAAETVAAFLSQEDAWHSPPNALLLLLDCIRTTTGQPLSDKLINKMALRPNCCELQPRCLCGMLLWQGGEWLPALRTPATFLKADRLAAIWETSGTVDPCPGLADLRIGLVLWCLRNPCAASLRFLRERSIEEPAALLALAILEPARFRDHIVAGVSLPAGEPASLMALFRVRGIPATTEIQGTTHLSTRIKERTLQIAELFCAYERLDWETIQRLHECLGSDRLKSCAPWLVWNLWTTMNRVMRGEDAFTVPCPETESVMSRAGVHTFGLLLQLAHGGILPATSKAEAAVAACAQLLASGSAIAPDRELLLWLDAISGYRLAADLRRFPKLALRSRRNLRYDTCYSQLANLLFTKTAERRESGGLPWRPQSGPMTFPTDKALAIAFTRLVVEKAEDEDPVEVFDLTPQTEIQARLLRKRL